jgi:hypothetical protein
MSPHTRFLLIALAALPPLLSASNASAGPAPLGIASSDVDAKHEREVRRHEARIDHLQRSYDHHSAQCMHGEEEACEKARIEYGEMQDLRPLVPATTR